MQLGRRFRVNVGSACVAGDPNGSLFTASLAQNAGMNGRILIQPLGEPCVIRDIQVVSVDANLWEFWFWGNSLFQTGDARERFYGYYPMALGLQIGGAGLYHAQSNATTGASLDLYYVDEDSDTASGPLGQATSNQQIGTYLNVTLINRSSGGKTNNGYFTVAFTCEPVLGW